MGVSVEEWRQRIGSHHLASFRGCKRKDNCMGESSECASRHWRLGIGGSTFVVILIAVFIGNVILQGQIPDRCSLLLLAGDVELNPGPDLLSEEMISALLAEDYDSVHIQPTVVCNKHVIQLYQVVDKHKLAWKVAVKWLKILLQDFPADSEVDWARNIRESWQKLKKQKRRLQSDKNKSKEYENEFIAWENETYRLPSVKGKRVPNNEPAACTSVSRFELDVLKLEVQQQNDTIVTLTNENAELKERPSPHKYKLATRREKSHKSKISEQRTTVNELNKKVERQESKAKAVDDRKRSLETELKVLQVKHKKLEESSKHVKQHSCGDTIKEMESVIKAQKEYILQLQEANAKLHEELLQKEMKLTKMESGKVELMTLKNGHWTYTDKTRLCIYKLLSLHISFENVGPCLETVLEMLGLRADRLPCGHSIAIMNDERLLISQHQLQNLSTKKNLTLATDETPQSGKIYMTYTLTDDDGYSYVLGLRDMLSKSADDTLTTLKEILNDISSICNEFVPNDQFSAGMKILCQIKNTMSDRAATECKFNKILKTYREEILPKCKEGWDTMTQDAQQKLIEMNNFFCGLHLLITLADNINASFKQYEDIFFEENDVGEVGAKAIPGVYVTKSESGSVRTVRTVCKALAKGADEKSGCFRSWNTYLKSMNITKRYLQNFRGNRFNVVFLLGGCTFYLHKKVFDFLENKHGTENLLLKAVLADIQIPTYLAGCKVLGILNKLITAPLWRLIEKPGQHILNMCEHFTNINQFVNDIIDDESNEKLTQFVSCQISCFGEEFISRDEVLQALAEPWEHDRITLPMMKHTLCAIKQLLGRVVSDYLPGGGYHDLKDNEVFREETMSAPTHNKLPERVFGYLDFLLKKRPNISSIANEAQIMFVFNRTADYVQSLAPDELSTLIDQVRICRKDMRAKAKGRAAEMHEMLVKKMEEKERQLETTRRNRIKRKEKMTSTIIDAGLWQSREAVDAKMEQCTSDTERAEACKKQIQFRRKVLEQHLDGDKNFHFTSRGVKKTWTDLRDHLIKFIIAAQSVGEGKSLKKLDGKERLSIPLLTGKTVNHYFEEEGGELVPYRGQVIGQVAGFPTWFNITYDNDLAVYSYELVKDYKEGNLEIIPG